ncbi:MAG: terminase large subunit [Saprospiraceae bacterium]|nr:terminase large subunit [Saprospiraceae bacterium]
MERLGVEHILRVAKKFEFDETEAERVLNLIHLFKHTKGKWKGKTFNLLPHQAFFIAYLFGIKNRHGFRQIREAMICMSKKGGKSEIGGMIGTIFTFFDGENTVEGYVVANKTEQAKFAWDSAKGICKQLARDYPDFEADLKIYDTKMEHRIYQPSTGNFLKTLPYESNTLDGVNPHFALIDEFHEYPDTTVPDNLTSGMILREQPLLLYTTTRGFHPYGPLSQKEEYYENVLTGKVEDNTIFPMIYALDDDNNWTNKNFWIQFAPGVDDGLPSYDAIEAAQKKAIDEGGETLAATKVKTFNIWQRSKEEFVDPDAWEGGSEAIDELSLYGRECFAAFDLGRNDDLTALGYLFPPSVPGERFKFIMRTFMPLDMVSRRSTEHRVSYSQWINEGLVIPTPGNVTDTAAITDKILADSQKFKIKTIFADMAFAVEIINSLSAIGLPVEAFPQRYGTMNAPVLKVQSLVNSGQLQHGGNKVLDWMCVNVTLKKNTGGQVMMDKSDRISGKGTDQKKGRKKIDGMVVLAMCVSGWLDSINDEENSIYNTAERSDGFLTL